MTKKNCLTIKKFPIETMKTDVSILVTGSRMSGKTTLIKNIIYNLRKKLTTGFVIIPTSRKEYQNIVPNKHIMDKYEKETIRYIFDSSRDNKAHDFDIHTLLVLDDCESVNELEIKKYHMHKRHYNVTIIQSAQSIPDLDPGFRAQFDYIFCLSEKSQKRKELLYKYFGIRRTFEEFNKILDKCTENYGALVYDCTTACNGLSDCIFYYNANKNIPTCRIGLSVNNNKIDPVRTIDDHQTTCDDFEVKKEEEETEMTEITDITEKTEEKEKQNDNNRDIKDDKENEENESDNETNQKKDVRYYIMNRERNYGDDDDGDDGDDGDDNLYDVYQEECVDNE